MNGQWAVGLIHDLLRVTFEVKVTQARHSEILANVIIIRTPSAGVKDLAFFFFSVFSVFVLSNSRWKNSLSSLQAWYHLSQYHSKERGTGETTGSNKSDISKPIVDFPGIKEVSGNLFSEISWSNIIEPSPWLRPMALSL